MPYQTLDVPDFNGGWNNKSPQSKIPENSVFNILNFEYDEQGNSVSSRLGSQELGRGTGRISSTYGLKLSAGGDSKNAITDFDNGRIYSLDPVTFGLSAIDGGALVGSSATVQWKQ